MSGPKSLRWAFSPYADNWGDSSRALEVARALQPRGKVRFFHHGGRFAPRFTEAGFDASPLEPTLSRAQHDILLAIDQHRLPVGTPLPFSENELIRMVESELSFYAAHRTEAVYAGLNLTTLISAPYAKLPRVALLPTALCPAFFRRRLATFPEAMETNFWLRFVLPRWAKNALINRIMLGDAAKKTAETFNRVRRRFGLPPVYNYPELVRGDLTLLPDLPELSGLPAEALPPAYAYVGPIFARMDLPVPAEVEAVFARPGLNVYCAMGSSGAVEHFQRAVRALRACPSYNVVCATTSIVEPEALGPRSERFFATRFLPAYRVNPLADVALVHGGQGTVQNAVWSGTPVVGVAFQWEQQANLDGLARAGMAVRLSLHRWEEARIRAAVETVRGPDYRAAAQRLKAQVHRHDGAQEAARRIDAFVRGRPLPLAEAA